MHLKECGTTELFQIPLKKVEKKALSFTNAPLRLVKGVGDSFRSLPIQTVP